MEKNILKTQKYIFEKNDFLDLIYIYEKGKVFISYVKIV